MGIIDRLLGRKSEDYIGAALDSYTSSIEIAAKNHDEYCTWGSWASGAAALREGIIILEDSRKVQKVKVVPDSLEKAKTVVELFIQPMISISL